MTLITLTLRAPEGQLTLDDTALDALAEAMLLRLEATTGLKLRAVDAAVTRKAAKAAPAEPTPEPEAEAEHHDAGFATG